MEQMIRFLTNHVAICEIQDVRHIFLVAIYVKRLIHISDPCSIFLVTSARLTYVDFELCPVDMMLVKYIAYIM